MFGAENLLASEHGWRLAPLAGLVCAVAAVAALSLLNRAKSVRGRARAAWLAGAIGAVIFGAAATYFILFGVHTAKPTAMARAFIVTGIAFAVLGAGVAAAAIDRRLTQQNLLLDVALNNMTYGLMMFDAAGGLVLFNQRYVDLYRLPAGSIKLGMTVREVIDLRIANGAFNLDAGEYCRDVLDSIGRGEVSKRVMEMEDGRTIAVTGEPLACGGWIATHQDITEEKRREASFRFLFDENPLPMWVWDHETLGFLAVNKAAVEKYGYDRERFRTLTLRDIKRSPSWDIVNAVIKGDASPLTEGLLSQHAKADGSLIDVEIYGRPLVYQGRRASLAAPVDVTQRKRVEGELRAAREFFNTVLESVPSVIAVKDAADKKYIFINRAGEDHFGMMRGQVIGKTAQELFPPQAAAVIEGRDQDLLASGTEQFYDTHAIPTAHNGKRYVTSRRVLIRDEKAEPRYVLNVVEDVTNRKRQEDELRRTRTFLDSIVENVPAMLTVKNAHDLRYALVNRAAEQLFGRTREEIIGKTAMEVFPRDSTTQFDAMDREVVETGALRAVEEHAFERPSGEKRLLTTKKLLVRSEDNKAQYVLTLSEDITDRKLARDKIDHMARHDTLTDLPNRATFNEKLAGVLESAVNSGNAFAVLSVDLDRFKEVNDVFGNAAGDTLLCEVARRLGEAAAGAFLARLGGDEFALIVSDGAQPSTAETIAERLMESVATDIVCGEHSLHVGLSIGVAVYPSDGKDTTALVANANAALYRAKAAGRGTIRFFEAHMDERLRERRALQHELHEAIEQRELILHYQPQARIGGETIGFEALVRWHHPIRGVISPGTFVPLAEESDLIVAMGEWILREACREAASWPKPLQVAVNLSPIQFRHGDLPALVHTILLETGLAPHRLELEITEGVLINDFTRAVSILRRLKLLGVSIAMDDFGTGYSSLSYLQSFPFDKIKIDRTFIANLTDNHYSATIVRAVIGLGRGLNLPVMAEGVETAEQLAFLAREACDEVQGYHIGHPAPIDSYAELVGRGATPKLKVMSG